MRNIHTQSQSTFTRKEQVTTKSVSQEQYVNHCVVQEVHEETSLQECQANVMDDKNCPVNMQPVKPVVFDDRKCQSTKFYKNSVCQSTRCYKKKYPVTSVCDDKTCQSNVCSIKSCQTHMQSVTKPSYMWLAKPAIIQSIYKKSLCNDKNCQSTKGYKKMGPIRPVCHDKNCQAARCVHMQKSAMPQSIHKKVSHSTYLYRKQTGTQPEVSRNCTDSTSKSCCPKVSPVSRNYKKQSNHKEDPSCSKMQPHMWPVNAESKKSQVL